MHWYAYSPPRGSRGCGIHKFPAMTEDHRARINWLDLLWLAFLAGLAALPPVREYHKQITLAAIGLVQLLEGRVIAWKPKSGPAFVILLKIFLATVLIDHTGGLSINSSYYPAYYVPVVTAAVYCGPWGTLLWTAVASAAYCSYLYPALQDYTLTPEGTAELLIRILFFFLAAMVVNRFVMEARQQTKRQRDIAQKLTEVNQQLQRAQSEARRSERLAALGQLSAGLAHEIRNPLGVIKGSAEMLTQKLATADPLSSELAGYISSEVNRLSSLVTRFLDFARPLHAEARPQELTAILDRALHSVAELWKGGRIEVQKEYDSGLPQVLLDEGLCEQVFVNLAQNAYEAMGDSGGVFRVEVHAASSNGSRGAEVRLQDTGPGVPAELRDQIFNPFVTTKKTGVSLGLSIVSKVMDEHHGSIRVGNGESGGACFVLFFPAEEQIDDATSKANDSKVTA